MPQTDITVNYANGVVSTDPADPTVTTPGMNVIQWAPGTGVSSITGISGLKNPPFSAPTSIGNGQWKSNDQNSGPGTYSYTITIVAAGPKGGAPLRHDPQITNNPQD